MIHATNSISRLTPWMDQADAEEREEYCDRQSARRLTVSSLDVEVIKIDDGWGEATVHGRGNGQFAMRARTHRHTVPCEGEKRVERGS